MAKNNNTQKFDEIIPFDNQQGRNDRFSYAKVRRGNEWFFLKTARKSELQTSLQREVSWADFMSHVVALYPELRIRGPKIYGFEGNSLLMEFIDAPQVAVSSDLNAWKANLDRYVDVLVALDRAANRWSAPDLPYDASVLSAPQDVEKVWRRWLGKHYDDVEGLTQAEMIVKEHLPAMTMRFQHGDLTPWQMFNLGNEWIIFDGEKAGAHLPRYNDLAYAYGRLFTRLQDHQTAADLLTKFIEKSGVDKSTFEKEFMPVALFRSVGMVGDAYNDKERNYLVDANELLGRSLTCELNALLKVA